MREALPHAGRPHLVHRFDGRAYPLSPGPTRLPHDVSQYTLHLPATAVRARLDRYDIPVDETPVVLHPEEAPLELLLQGAAGDETAYYVEGPRPPAWDALVLQALGHLEQSWQILLDAEAPTIDRAIRELELVDDQLLTGLERDPFAEMIPEIIKYMDQIGPHPRVALDVVEESVPTRYVRQVLPRSIRMMLEHPETWEGYRGGRPVPRDLLTEVPVESYDLYENRFVVTFHGLVRRWVAGRMKQLTTLLDNLRSLQVQAKSRDALQVLTRRMQEAVPQFQSTVDQQVLELELQQYAEWLAQLDRIAQTRLFREVSTRIPLPAQSNHALRTAPHYRQLFPVHREWERIRTEQEARAGRLPPYPLLYADFTLLALVHALYDLYFDPDEADQPLPLSSLGLCPDGPIAFSDKVRGLRVSIMPAKVVGEPLALTVERTLNGQQTQLIIHPLCWPIVHDGGTTAEALAALNRLRETVEAVDGPDRVLVLHPTLIRSLNGFGHDDVRLLYGYGDNFIHAKQRTPAKRRVNLLPGGFHDAMTETRLQRWLRGILEPLAAVMLCPGCGGLAERAQGELWRCTSCAAHMTVRNPRVKNPVCPVCQQLSRSVGDGGERGCQRCRITWTPVDPVERFLRCPQCGASGEVKPGSPDERICTNPAYRHHWGSRPCTQCQTPLLKIPFNPTNAVLELVDVLDETDAPAWAAALDQLVGGFGALSVCEDRSDRLKAFTGLYSICPECGTCGPPEAGKNRSCHRCDMKEGAACRQ